MPNDPAKAKHEWSSSGSFKHTSVRQSLRRTFFGFLQKITETDDARTMWSQALKGQLDWQPHLPPCAFECPPPPYAELGTRKQPIQLAKERAPIFITARFRSGSTFLWNLFRNIDGMTAYYEPLNERRWFNSQSRGGTVDPTHKHVDDYWREYEGLEILSEYYREEWIEKNLYMDATFWDPGMKRYVELMIEKAPGRPVLQFNRIDLRLPWFRRNFPQAKIVHLYRHPRDQWCSSLLDLKCFSKDGSRDQFPPHDKFYLRMWARDLKYHFPFLDEKYISHPYQMFYYIWKISYVFGLAFAHHSVAFEHVTTDPDIHLTKLLEVVNVHQYDLTKLKSLVEKAPIGKWRTYADDDWFKQHETHCEMILADFFASLESSVERQGI